MSTIYICIRRCLKRRLSLLACIFLVGFVSVGAQPGRVDYMDRLVFSLQMTSDRQASCSLPLLTLGGHDQLTVAFDYLDAQARRLTYSIVHLDDEGQPTTELFDNEYVRTTVEEPLFSHSEPSVYTSVAYQHYTLTLPNTDVQPLLSGNYRLTVTDITDDEPRPLLVACFGVVEPLAVVQVAASADTDIDRHDRHQQVSVQTRFYDTPIVNPQQEIRLTVLQNGRYDNAVRRPQPTSYDGRTLLWEHSRDLIFAGGSEYRRFEMLSPEYPGKHGERVWREGLFYHLALQPDEPCRNYIFDEDHNGASLIRTTSSPYPDTEADYSTVHFRLQTFVRPTGHFYLIGRWAQPAFATRYCLQPLPSGDGYELALPMKMGYYEYQYAYLDDSQQAALAFAPDAEEIPIPPRGNTALMEGDFYQTTNDYTALLYYRPLGRRYWRLVGVGQTDFKP